MFQNLTYYLSKSQAHIRIIFLKILKDRLNKKTNEEHCKGNLRFKLTLI